MVGLILLSGEEGEHVVKRRRNDAAVRQYFAGQLGLEILLIVHHGLQQRRAVGVQKRPQLFLNPFQAVHPRIAKTESGGDLREVGQPYAAVF